MLNVDKKMLQLAILYSIRPDISDLNLMVVFFFMQYRKKIRFLCEFQLQPIGGSFIAPNLKIPIAENRRNSDKEVER